MPGVLPRPDKRVAERAAERAPAGPAGLAARAAMAGAAQAASPPASSGQARAAQAPSFNGATYTTQAAPVAGITLGTQGAGGPTAPRPRPTRSSSPTSGEATPCRAGRWEAKAAREMGHPRSRHPNRRIPGFQEWCCKQPRPPINDPKAARRARTRHAPRLRRRPITTLRPSTARLTGATRNALALYTSLRDTHYGTTLIAPIHTDLIRGQRGNTSHWSQGSWRRATSGQRAAEYPSLHIVIPIYVGQVRRACERSAALRDRGWAGTADRGARIHGARIGRRPIDGRSSNSEKARVCQTRHDRYRASCAPADCTPHDGSAGCPVDVRRIDGDPPRIVLPRSRVIGELPHAANRTLHDSACRAVPIRPIYVYRINDHEHRPQQT